MKTIGRLALISIQLVGLAFSALLVGVTFSNPDQVKERLQEFAIAEVERMTEEVLINKAIEQGESDFTERLLALSDHFGVKASDLDARRKEVVPAILALAKLETCQENCEFWVAISEFVNTAMVKRVSKIKVGQRTLSEFVVERYENSVNGLLTDLRRFGFVNILVLSLMLGLVVFRNYLNWRFIAFAVALTGYTAFASYGYLFDQNWALAIILQDWAAPGYQTAMIFFAILFFDWLFLRARITESTMNLISSVLSG